MNKENFSKLAREEKIEELKKMPISEIGWVLSLGSEVLEDITWSEIK